MSWLFAPQLHWVRDIGPHRIALTPCPPGGAELAAHVDGWKSEGVDLVVSLLQAHEQKAFGIEDEASQCARAGLSFRSFAIRDHDVPESADAFAVFVEDVLRDVTGGGAVLIHCLAGIGRTGLLASGLLYRLGVPRASIGPTLQRSRGFAMPETWEQRQWLESFYERLAAPGPSRFDER